MDRNRNRSRGLVANLAAYAAMDIPIYSYYNDRPSPKPCALPECNTLTNHNGGYCCGANCRKHKQMLKDT